MAPKVQTRNDERQMPHRGEPVPDMEASDSDAPPERLDSAAQEILGYSFLRVFVRNGVLDEAELHMIEDLALRDGVVDSRERAVLSRVFDRIDHERLDDGARDWIAEFRERHGIR